MDIQRYSPHPSLRAAFTPLSSAAVLPAQFFTHPAIGPEGEIALRRAALENALHCFQQQFVTHTRHVQRLAREEEAWFFVDDYDWPFSFINICSVLGLDPAAIRHELRRWHQGTPAMPRKRKHRRGPASSVSQVAA